MLSISFGFLDQFVYFTVGRVCSSFQFLTHGNSAVCVWLSDLPEQKSALFPFASQLCSGRNVVTLVVDS